MKIVQIYRYGKPDVLKVEETAKPTIKSNEVLVKVYCAAVNPKDIITRKGKFKQFTGNKFPIQLGFDISGEIVEAGAKAPFKVGDKIMGMLNGFKGGGYAEYVAIKHTEIALKPKQLNYEEAAALPLVSQTSLQALRDLGKVKAGYKVCINGASGGVGTVGIQLAKVLGGHVTATCSYRNVERCKALGADEVIDYTKENILDSNEQFDVFYDVFGNLDFKKVKPLLKSKGVYINTVPSPKIIKDQIFTYFSGKKAKLVVVKSNSKDLQYLAKLVEEGHFKPIVDKIYPLEEVRAAHEYIETKRAKGKVILKIKN